MEITFHEQVPRTINLPYDKVKEIARTAVLNLLSPGEYLREDKDGKVWLMEDEWCGHGSPIEKRIREATELDKAVMLVSQALRN